MNHCYISIVLSMFYACSFAQTDNTSTDLILLESFERADLYTNGWWNKSGNDKGRISDQVSREGTKAARFEVELTDDGDYRSELAGTEESPAPRNYTIGEEYWYGVSIYPEKGMVTSPVSEIVLQFHSTPDNVPGETWSSGLNPPMALACNGERWQITVRGDDKSVTTKPHYLFEITDDLGPVQQGAWTDWVFNIKWNYDGNGFVRIWKNGKMVYNLVAPNTFNDQKGPYLKMGVYAFYLRRPERDSWKQSKEVGVTKRIYYHDAIRIADKRGNCATVSPADVTCEPVQKEMEVHWKNL